MPAAVHDLKIRKDWRLFQNAAGTVLRAPEFVLYYADDGLLQLTCTTNGSTALDLSESAVEFGVRAMIPLNSPGNYALSDPLIYSSGEEQVNVDGDWASLSPVAGRVSIRYNAATVPALAHFLRMGQQEVPVLAEVRVTEEDGRRWVLAQGQGVFRLDVLRPGDPEPENLPESYIGRAEVVALLAALLVDDLGTAETDTNKRLAPDGEGGVQWLTGSGGGVTDHGALTGLGDDDHTQYHNNARGDARYVGLTGNQSIDGVKTITGVGSKLVLGGASQLDASESAGVLVPDSSTAGEAVNNTRLAAYAAPVPVVVSGNQTAANNTTYHNVASATYTDPSPPAEGKGYVVVVINGTATVGGTGYSVAGTILHRYYHSGAWQTVRVYKPVSPQDLILTPNDFQGPYNTGSNDDAGYVVGDLDTGTYRARGVGIATASATQQSKVYEMQVRVPSNWSGFAASGNVFELQWWAGSSTSTDCKMDVSITGVSAIGASANTIYSATNQAVTSANVPQTLSVALAGLTSSTLPAMLIVRVTLYARNNLGTYIGGGLIRGQ